MQPRGGIHIPATTGVHGRFLDEVVEEGGHGRLRMLLRILHTSSRSWNLDIFLTSPLYLAVTLCVCQWLCLENFTHALLAALEIWTFFLLVPRFQPDSSSICLVRQWIYVQRQSGCFRT